MCVDYVNNASTNICPDSLQSTSHAVSTSQPVLQTQAASTSTDVSCDDQSSHDVRQLDMSEHNEVTTSDSSVGNSVP